MIITKFRIVVAKLLVMFYVLKLLFIILFLSFFNLYRLLYIVLCYLFTIPKELFKNWAHRDGESELMGRCGRWEKRGTHQLNQGYCSRPNLGVSLKGNRWEWKGKVLKLLYTSPPTISKGVQLLCLHLQSLETPPCLVLPAETWIGLGLQSMLKPVSLLTVWGYIKRHLVFARSRVDWNCSVALQAPKDVAPALGCHPAFVQATSLPGMPPSPPTPWCPLRIIMPSPDEWGLAPRVPLWQHSVISAVHWWHGSIPTRLQDLQNQNLWLLNQDFTVSTQLEWIKGGSKSCRCFPNPKC